jgi:hypothetical protein
MTTAQLGATLTQLRKERIRIERLLAGVDDAIRAISGVVGSGSGSLGRRRWHSDAVRKKIAKAQKARWARLKRESAAQIKSGKTS